MKDAPIRRSGRPPARYSSLGLRFAFRSNDEELLARLDALYAACHRDDDRAPHLVLDVDRDGASDLFDLNVDGESCVRAVSRAEVLEWCAWKTNDAAIRRDRRELVLHAAGVADADRAIVIAAASGSGKSTLAAALTLHGLRYMGDDGLAVDGMQLRSNPKPIALDESSCRALTPLAPANAELNRARGIAAPTALGPIVPTEVEVTPALILQPRYRPGAATTLTPMTPGAAAELLADQSFNFPACGRAGLQTVAALARHAPAFVVEFDDLDDVVTTITAQLTALPVPHLEARVARFERSGLDVELVDDEALVWDQGRQELHRLTATAAAVWDACASTTDATEIAAVLASGAGGASAAHVTEIERCIAELTELGLISSVS